MIIQCSESLAESREKSYKLPKINFQRNGKGEKLELVSSAPIPKFHKVLNYQENMFSVVKVTLEVQMSVCQSIRYKSKPLNEVKRVEIENVF